MENTYETGFYEKLHLLQKSTFVADGGLSKNKIFGIGFVKNSIFFRSMVFENFKFFSQNDYLHK